MNKIFKSRSFGLLFAILNFLTVSNFTWSMENLNSSDSNSESNSESGQDIDTDNIDKFIANNISDSMHVESVNFNLKRCLSEIESENLSLSILEQAPAKRRKLSQTGIVTDTEFIVPENTDLKNKINVLNINQNYLDILPRELFKIVLLGVIRSIIQDYDEDKAYEELINLKSVSTKFAFFIDQILYFLKSHPSLSNEVISKKFETMQASNITDGPNIKAVIDELFCDNYEVTNFTVRNRFNLELVFLFARTIRFTQTKLFKNLVLIYKCSAFEPLYPKLLNKVKSNIDFCIDSFDNLINGQGEPINDDEDTALSEIIRCKEYKSFKDFMYCHTDANYLIKDGNDLVIKALKYLKNYKDIFKLLAYAGADMDCVIDIAISKRETDILKFMILSKVNVLDEQDRILNAVIDSSYEILEQLLDLDVNHEAGNFEDDEHHSALYYAFLFCKVKKAKLLLSRGYTLEIAKVHEILRLLEGRSKSRKTSETINFIKKNFSV